MGGFFGVASKNDCVLDLFYGVDYQTSHLGTRRGGMAVYGAGGVDRAIHQQYRKLSVPHQVRAGRKQHGRQSRYCLYFGL